MSAATDVLQTLMSVLDEDRARAVAEHRKVTIKKPLTAYAAKLLVKRLSEYPGGANAAADYMIERAWRGFDASWVRNAPAHPNAPKRTAANVFDDYLGQADEQTSSTGSAEGHAPRIAPYH